MHTFPNRPASGHLSVLGFLPWASLTLQEPSGRGLAQPGSGGLALAGNLQPGEPKGPMLPPPALLWHF